MTVTEPILVFAEDNDVASRLAALLHQGGLTARQEAVRCFSKTNLTGAGGGLEALEGASSGLAIVVECSPGIAAFPGLLDRARRQGMATLLVVGRLENQDEFLGRILEADGWVSLEAVGVELATRATEVLRRQSSAHPLPAFDPRFLALVIHDLRTPLNVIGLTIRAMAQTKPDPDPEFEDDLTFLKENAGQIEKMLSQLGDYCRLLEGEGRVLLSHFDPRRFLTDFIEIHRSRPGSEACPIRLELSDALPSEVLLDQNRVRLALQHCLSNAINAAGSTPVRVRSRGTETNWVVEFVVDKPPPQTVTSRTLHPDQFERLSGSAAERRGLDLAIAASITERFGGTARLEVEPDRRSSIVLEWPRNPANS